jgi:glycosyltransferase involved in cell wall biosynthesis
LYFSVNEWGNMGRRKPRLAHEFARRAEVASVLYVEPPVRTSFPDLVRGRLDSGHLEPSRRAHLKALLGQPRQVEEGVWAYTGSTKTLPLTRFGALRRLGVLKRFNQTLYLGWLCRCLNNLPGERLILWLTHPLQVFALDAFPKRALLCYDWTDDWAEFDWLPVDDREELIAWNDRIVRQADVVFAVSEGLTRRARALNNHVYRAPNATDWDVIGAASQSDGPAAPELASLRRPIIGYTGQVADKMDYGLIRAIAEARPDWSFVFIGKVWSSRRTEVEALAELSNICFLGFRPYEQLPAYLRGFDVCIIPHLVNRLTRSMNPIKLFDYLATGKPIVSTSVAGVGEFADVVRVADGPEEFVAALEATLVEDGALAAQRLLYAQANTWPVRAEQMWRVIANALE